MSSQKAYPETRTGWLAGFRSLSGGQRVRSEVLRGPKDLRCAGAQLRIGAQEDPFLVPHQ
jgi:hypothetical protein